MTTTMTPTRTFTRAALDNELKRRKKNRKRKAQGIDIARSKSFVLRKMSQEQMGRVKDGETVTVTFNTGRVEHVALKDV